jgi:hypothetical protein
MNETEIFAQIEKAFSNTPSPGVEFDDISATKQDEGIVEYFRGTTWRGHRVRDLRYHSAALSFFTPKAFRYWLAAFMLAELEDPDTADVIRESIAFNLTYPNTTEATLSEFAQDELKAIAAFLDECDRRYSDEMFRNAATAVRARIIET